MVVFPRKLHPPLRTPPPCQNHPPPPPARRATQNKTTHHPKSSTTTPPPTQNHLPPPSPVATRRAARRWSPGAPKASAAPARSSCSASARRFASKGRRIRGDSTAVGLDVSTLTFFGRPSYSQRVRVPSNYKEVLRPLFTPQKPSS